MAEEPNSSTPARNAPVLPAKYWLPLLIALLVSGAILVVAELTYRAFSETRGEITAGMAFQSKIMELEKTLSQAETAQRGYLLTHAPLEAEAFRKLGEAMRPVSKQLRDLVGEKDAATREKLAMVSEVVTLKFAQLESTLDRATKGDPDGARAELDSEAARALNARVAKGFQEVMAASNNALDRRAQHWESSMDSNRHGILAVVALNATLIALLALVLIRDTRRAHAVENVHQQLTERMKREVADRTAQLSSLSEFLQTQSELEKAKLARELHDELGGILTPAKMDVNWLEGRLGSDNDIAARLMRLTKLLDSGIDVKRRIIENLRPSLLDHLGLAAAVKWHVEETCKSANLDCQLALGELERLSPDVEIALYRVVQESLTNVVKHANAKRVELSLQRTAEGIVVLVSDDGQGIPDLEAAQRKSYGIGGIRQRLSGLGGTFEMDTGAGKGTRIRAFVPLKPAAAAAA